MADLSASSLLLGFLFGSVGLAFFIYGKRQSAFAPLLCGLLLMVIPYFITSTVGLIAAGAVLVAIPFFVRM